MAPASNGKAKPVKFEFDSAKVTYHAVTRYVQRALGFTVACEGLSSRGIAEAHAAAAGLTVELVQRRIYTPAAAAALAMGVPKFTVGAFTFAARDGFVLTVTSRKIPKTSSDRRLRVLTEGENRRWAARYARRQRRRPNVHQPDDNGD